MEVGNATKEQVEEAGRAAIARLLNEGSADAVHAFGDELAILLAFDEITAGVLSEGPAA
jgi:hypothetical protein